MSLALTDPNNLENVIQHAANTLNMTPLQFSQCCEVDSNRLLVTLPFACAQLHSPLIDSLITLGLDAEQIELRTAIAAKRTKLARLRGVKNLIAIASGKGGVGKSATSVNLAFALQAQGAKVGILDADIYGPSIPIMLGNPQAQPQSEDNRLMSPLDCHGVAANSIGYLVPAENATIWRGPMASKALQQLVNETRWPELDYLIVDMPPGTGDIQLTMAQMVPLTAAIVVTTPQDIALADATKGIAMFEKVDIPVLGLIENMSYYQCRKCGHKDHVFASGGGEKLAQQHDLCLLGQLPLDIHIREHADGGNPLIISQPDSVLAQTYMEMALQVSKRLAYSSQLSNDDSIDIATV